MKKWIIKAEQELFRRKIFAIKDKECYHPDKKVTHKFLTFDIPDWINVVAMTEEGTFIMVKQHRLGTNEVTLETPGGLINEGESPEETARRELREETGYEAGEIHLLKKLSVNPSIFNNYIYFYYAGNCTKIHEQDLDSAEIIEVLTVTHDQIMEMISGGRINHTIIVAAFYLYFLSEWSGLVDKNQYLYKLV